MAGKRPLEDDDLNAVLRAADRLGGFDRFIAYTLAFTGVRASTLAHMGKDWVDFQDRHVEVPAFQECTAGRGGNPCSECVRRLGLLDTDPAAADTYANPADTWDGQGNSLYARSRRFERYAGRDGLTAGLLAEFLETKDGMWFPKSGHGHRNVPVKEDRAWRVIRDWFNIHTEVMVTRQTVGNHVDTIAKKAGLTRKLEPHEFRHTYGTRLAEMEFNAYEIRDAMGHATTRQAETYIRLAGKRIESAFDKKWKSL